MRRSTFAWLGFLQFLLLGTAPTGAAAGQVAARGPARPDLLLVTIDTLRADAPGFAGNPRVATPILDRLAAAGRVFVDAHAHSVVTLPSHTNILTGLYPYQHGVRENSGFVLAANVPTLASALAGAGYATAAFVSGFPLDSRFGLDRGFAVYDDRFTTAVADEQFAISERRGDQTVAAALAWWRRESGRPRFLWVHLFEPHAPYAPLEPFASRYRATPYLGEVAAADAYLEPLLGPLLAGAERPALVAVTGDHGEGLGDHGEQTHGLFCYEATLAVPLVLWGAGVERGRDLRAARHVDLFPTFLAAAGVEPPAPPALGSIAARPGRSLLAPASPAPSTSYFESLSAALNRGWAPLRGLLAGGTKWIELPVPELYRLPMDPREERNLVDAERPTARALAAQLPSESRWPPPRAAVSSEETARLRALGYLSESGGPRRTSFGPEDDPKRLLPLDQKIFATIDAYSRGDLATARALAREVVAARPAMPLGRSLLAQALLQAGDRDGALAVMRQARAEGVASDELLRQLGLTLAEAGKSDDALAVLGPLARAGDRDAACHLALALSEAGRQEEAAREIASVIAAHPDEARAHEVAALVALRRERFEEARRAAAQAVELAPGRAAAWNDLGVALFQLGRPGEALDAWQRAVDLAPELVDAQWNLGVEAAKLGRREQARRALAAFIERAPQPRYAADVAEARQRLAALTEEDENP